MTDETRSFIHSVCLSREESHGQESGGAGARGVYSLSFSLYRKALGLCPEEAVAGRADKGR